MLEEGEGIRLVKTYEKFLMLGEGGRGPSNGLAWANKANQATDIVIVSHCAQPWMKKKTK